MGWLRKISQRLRPVGPAYPQATANVRITQDDPELIPGLLGRAGGIDLYTIPAKFPLHVYELIENLMMLDPYMSKYHYTTVALANQGHNLEITAANEARADLAISVANDFAARCFPLSGGMDGLMNGLFSQVARSGGMCVEWVPDLSLSSVKRAYLVPIKTLRFRYDASGDPELLQEQAGKLVSLNPVQVSFQNAVPHDGNPYPVPPTIAAIEACSHHRNIMRHISTWMKKISVFGVLWGQVKSPPRMPGEEQSAYDARASIYLDKIAKSVAANLNSGMGIAYDNVQFTFANTQAGAQGAKDILQIVLQGLFAALNRHPIFFGWNFTSTESFARVVYDELQRGLKAFQLAAKRVVEHGHRLNFALNSLGDIGVSVSFKSTASVDAFRDAEAKYMESQTVLSQYEAKVITFEEARRLLGHDEKKASSEAFIASYSTEQQRYLRIPCDVEIWELYEYHKQRRHVDTKKLIADMNSHEVQHAA
jgi:hypothetical protein